MPLLLGTLSPLLVVAALFVVQGVVLDLLKFRDYAVFLLAGFLLAHRDYAAPQVGRPFGDSLVERFKLRQQPAWLSRHPTTQAARAVQVQ